jgi:malonate-semialdehyde dehydrogenase (acetylating) / methylmalonate-semialdehyde dehydrogenase
MKSIETGAAPRTPTPTEAHMLRNYVGGSFTESSTAETLDDRNPATGEMLARVPLSNAADVDAAVRAARAAQLEWGATPVLERARALYRLREVLEQHFDELVRLVTRDMGKTLTDARGEVRRGIESVEAASGIVTLMKGENLESVAHGIDVDMIRQPVGVVAAITPFNFPAMIPLWFLPFAIAAGNAFVLKPSEHDPLPSHRLIELVDELAEVPKGVVSLVHGARDAVDALLDHPEVDAVSFVGQAATARYVASRAIQNGKRVQALGGAKNTLVLLPDADPEASVAGVLSSAFGAAGQRCLAGSVAVLVGTRQRQDELRERLVAAAARLRTGAGDDPDTDVCPLVSPEARERVEAGIAQAEAGGAEVVLNGRGDGGAAGAELGPTVIEAADPESTIVREELFGPVLALVRAPDLEAAIEFVNGSRYGNACMLFTASGASAQAFRSRVQVGMLGVNVGIAAPVAWFPFAGWKDSFNGDLHANGSDAVEFYTRKKVITSRWP